MICLITPGFFSSLKLKTILFLTKNFFYFASHPLTRSPVLSGSRGSVLADSTHLVSGSSCGFRTRSSPSQLPLGVMPLPPDPCLQPLVSSFCLEIPPLEMPCFCVALIWSLSSLYTFDGEFCHKTKFELLDRASVAP